MRIGVSLPVRELEDDLGAIKDFAQTAEALGYTHLRVPDQVLWQGNKHLHEPMMLLAWVAAVTQSIELVPSVMVRETALSAKQVWEPGWLPTHFWHLHEAKPVLFAKQVAELYRLSGGRVRIEVGVGASADEYRAMGHDFGSRGRLCDEQLELLKCRGTGEEAMNFQGRWEWVESASLNPLPEQRPIPVWIGGRAVPSPAFVRRIGAHADGWFVLCSPEDFPAVKAGIDQAARAAGRQPGSIGTEAGVAVVGLRQAEWRDRVSSWRGVGLTHLCLRTLGGGLDASAHLATLKQAAEEVPGGLVA